MGSQSEERCLLFSSFPLLPLPGAQLLGSRLNVNFLQTVKPLDLALALEAAISIPGSRNVTRLRSGATLATTTTTNVGTETTVSNRLASGTDALVFAMRLATGTLRTIATWVWTPTTAGWATGARTRAWGAALPSQDLVAWITAATTTAATPGPALALAPLALTLTPRSAKPPRSIATLAWTQRAAGTATTASTRLTSGMVATEFARRMVRH